MDRIELQKLRELPIEGVAERLGLTVKRHKCLCPFHNDHHASLSFKVSKNTYRCFVCGASGGPIDLVMRYLNKDFLDACHWLADEHNVIISNKKDTKGSDPFVSRLSPCAGEDHPAITYLNTSDSCSSGRSVTFLT